MIQNYKERIIQPAWELTRLQKKVKKMNFFGWLLSVIFLTFLLTYQAIYTYVIMFGQRDKALELIIDFFESKFIVEVLVFGWIFLLFYIFLVPIIDAALIKHIDSIYKKEENSISESIGFWTYKFFVLFEYNNLFNTFKFVSVLNWFLFLLRFLWIEYFAPLTYVFVWLFFIATLINIFLSYAKYEIVLKNKKVFESIATSARITLMNLGLTMKIYSLMFIVNLRVLLNFFIFLAFPIAIASALTYLSSQLYIYISISILSIIFIAFILLLAHMASVLEIFKVSVWYLTYKEWSKKLESIEKDTELVTTS